MIALEGGEIVHKLHGESKSLESDKANPLEIHKFPGSMLDFQTCVGKGEF